MAGGPPALRSCRTWCTRSTVEPRQHRVGEEGAMHLGLQTAKGDLATHSRPWWAAHHDTITTFAADMHSVPRCGPLVHTHTPCMLDDQSPWLPVLHVLVEGPLYPHTHMLHGVAAPSPPSGFGMQGLAVPVLSVHHSPHTHQLKVCQDSSMHRSDCIPAGTALAAQSGRAACARRPGRACRLKPLSSWRCACCPRT